MTAAAQRIAGAGKGGAGLLTVLKTLGYAASGRGWHMAYTSNYNPETRGGLVEGTLAMSPEGEVTSPVLDTFTALLAFDRDGYDAYGTRLDAGGLVLWDRVRVGDPPAITGCSSYGFPIHEIAHGVDAPRSANMVLLGALCRLGGLFSNDELDSAMREFLPPWRHHLVQANRRVLDAVDDLDLADFRVG